MRTASRIIVILAAFVVAIGAAVAAEKKPTPIFQAGEIRVQGFGYSETPDARHFVNGGGLGADWFAWGNTGIGIEAQTRNTESAALDRINASFVGRMPLEKLRLAPEIRVGYGFDFERGDSRQGGRINHDGHEILAGAGFEWRPTKKIGIGPEIRGVKPLNGSSERLQGILKLSLNF